METAAFLGMLGLGYAMSKPNEESKKKEGFESSPANTLANNYTNYASIIPGVAVQQPPLKWEAPSGIRTNSAKKLNRGFGSAVTRNRLILIGESYNASC
jgi:hypothetical protein